MPFCNDLRAGYFSLDFNMAWFYTSMEEMEYDIEFKDSTFDTKNYSFHKKMFETHIERAAEKYIIVKAFGITNGKENQEIDSYDSIWFYLEESALDYATENDNGVIIKKIKSNDDSNDENE